MINNIEILEERIRALGDETLYDLSYNNRMALGLLITYISDINSDPFAIYNYNESHKAFQELRKYIVEQLEKVDKLFYEIKESFDDDEKPVSDDLIVEQCIDTIMNYWDNGKRMKSLYHHLKKDNFDKIYSYDEYKEQLEKYNDLSDLDFAFKNYWDTMPYEIIDNIFDNRVYL